MAYDFSMLDFINSLDQIILGVYSGWYNGHYVCEKRNLHCKLPIQKENDDQKLLLKDDVENIIKIWNFLCFRDRKFLFPI